MPGIFQTDKAMGHFHAVYVSEATGRGQTSADDGHVHDVVFDPERNDWVIGFGPDGHGHVLEDVAAPGYKTKKQEPAEVLQEVYSLASVWVSEESDNIRDAELAEQFYWGEQWEKNVKATLESQGRAALTINRIEKMVDYLTGEERQERTDIRYYPTEGGDQRVADILNHLTKHLLEASYYSREKSKVFEDIVIAGRSGFNLSVDFRKNIQGDIRVERFPWQDVVFGPHELEDLSDCEGLVKHKMYSRARLKSMFPEKAEEIDGAFVEGNLTTSTTGVQSNDAQDYQDPTSGIAPTFIAPTFLGTIYPTLDIAKKELRLIECWRKVYEKVHVIVNLDENFYFAAEGWSSAFLSKLKSIPSIQIVERETEKIRITKIVGGVLLSDEYPADLPEDDFFIVPVFGKRRNGKWKGKVISAIDSQKEVNKRHSQAIDIGNQAGYGYFYDSTTFNDEKQERDFEHHASAPNFKIKVADARNPPIRQEGVKFPSEVVQLLQLSDNSLVEMMSTEVMPNGANQSGAHFLEMKKSKMVVNEYLFDNMRFAQKKVGQLLVKLIQRYYRPDRILRILQSRSMVPNSPDMMVGGQPFGNYDPNEILSLLETADLLNYDVMVSESGYSPTARTATFMLLTQMAQSGAPIPPEIMVEFMDIPAELKSQVQGGIAQQAQAQAQTQSANAKMEINKTLIAKGIIPPEVQQELDGQGAQPQQMPAAPQEAPPPGL